MQMPRYFLHMKQGAHLVRDDEGCVLRNAEEAHTEAIEAAREICAEAIKNGKEIAADAFVVVDEAGADVAFLPITDSLPQRLRRTEPMASTRGNTLPAAIDLIQKFENVCALKRRADRLHAEIDQQVQSCQRTIGDIRKQLSAF
jgi:hypothetical protein